MLCLARKAYELLRSPLTEADFEQNCPENPRILYEFRMILYFASRTSELKTSKDFKKLPKECFIISNQAYPLLNGVVPTLY